MKNKIFAAAVIALLAFGQVGRAENGWDIQTSTSGSVTTFTISRTNMAVAETVKYRFVNLSVYAGQHYNVTQVNGESSGELSGNLTFAAGDDKKIIKVTESTATTYAYKYQATNSKRSYKLELTDVGGFYLTEKTRSFYTGTTFTDAYLNKSITDLVYFNNGSVMSGSGNKYLDVAHSDTNGKEKVIYDEYDYNNSTLCTVNTGSLYDNDNDMRSWLNSIGYKMYATVYFQQFEIFDGYQYIQILADNATTYDGKDGDGKIDNGPTKSLYKAAFILTKNENSCSSWKYQAFPHRYDDHTSSTEFDYSDSYLYEQKFRSPYYRATNSGSLVLNPTVNNINVRFDANGSYEDTWYLTNLKVRLALVDATAPTKQAISVAPGKHAKGNTIYVSVAFDEIVRVTGTPKLTTDNNWGDLSYVDGDGTNVLTFSGTISNNASGSLNVTSLSGTVKDLAGNGLAGSGVATSNLCSLDTSYAYTITYDLDGGSADNPSTYTYETATFTLNNPTKFGYRFDGWTGSNGNTPQTTVTINNHSKGDRSYTAHWTRIWEGSGEQSDPYIIATTEDLNMLAKVTNGTDGFTANSSSGVFYRLDRNLDFGGDSFDGIGSSTVYLFNGTFDGNGKTISNFVIDKPNVERVALFGNCAKGTVKNLIVNNATVTGNNYVGIIVGTSYNGTFSNCLVFNSRINCNSSGGVIYGQLSSMNVSGCHYANCNINGTPASDMYFLTLGDGITASGETVVHNFKEYYVCGTTVTLSSAENAPTGYEKAYWVNGTAITGNTFTMPEQNTSVTFSIVAKDFTADGHSGDSEADAYIIYNKEQLDLLAKMVNGTDGYTSNTFKNKYIKLANDITYDGTENNFTPIGNSSHYFLGTFDGNGRHTISGININSKDNDQGLFGYFQGTVKDVVLHSSTIIGQNYVGSIVGHNNGGTIRNCLVTSTTVRGENQGAIVANGHGTLANNYYYNCTVGDATINVGTNMGDVDGARSVHTLTLPAGVTATGESVVIDASTYYAAGTSVTLSAKGYTITGGYTVKDAQNKEITLTGSNTFVMPTSDVTVTVASITVIQMKGSGTEKDPWIIMYQSQMEQLATHEILDKEYYQLGCDLIYSYKGLGETESNYRPVYVNAGGHFDGAGHTISGIRLYSKSSTKGLFSLNYGTVKNVTLTDAVITGYQYVGGIVGSNNQDGIIENCHVTNTVLIMATDEKYADCHGGIAGDNVGREDMIPVIRNCTSAATVIDNGHDDKECASYGGIVGQNTGGIVSGCIAYGASITAFDDVHSIVGYNYYYNGVDESPVVENCLAIGCTINGNKDAGAISGDDDEISRRNYYYNCTVNGNTSDIGSNDGDITKNDGAIRTVTSSTKPVEIGAEIATYPNSGLTVFEHGAYYNGTYYLRHDLFGTAVNLTLAQGTKDGITAYWGTFYDTESGYSLPAGASAYTMDAEYHLYRLGADGSVIPKATAVVIIADKADIFLNVLDDASATDNAPGGNILVGQDVDAVINGICVLSKNASGAVGFYPLSGSALPAHKAGYVPKGLLD